jgi:hypothetical protein
VGEREDAGDLSELEAMRHPRRNEVFRDVGSEPHDPDDPGFIDVSRVPFERDAALLLCTDGLTDQVDSATIATVVETFAGHPGDVVRELIESANEAGGKDNVTAVYVEGEQFIANRPRPDADLDLAMARPPAEADRIEDQELSRPVVISRSAAPDAHHPARRVITWVLALLLTAVVAAAILFETNTGTTLLRRLPIPAANAGQRSAVTIGPTESIATALANAKPGTDIIVEPGEYREALTLVSGVRLVSQVPRAATLRLSGTASDNEAVVTAARVSETQLIGFRIVGDAATPVGTGIYCDNANVSIVDVEISGAKNVAVEFDRGSTGTLLGSDLINNFGSALVVRGGAGPRVSHNRFVRNATAEAAPPWLILESGTSARFDGNIFEGLRAEAFPQLKEGNIFVPPASTPAAQSPGGGRRGHR